MANKNNKGGRPKVHWWIAQEVYVLVDEVERQNKPITRRQAIYKFMEGDKFKNLLTNYHKVLICNTRQRLFCFYISQDQFHSDN